MGVAGASLDKIAQLLGRSQSSVSREINRNTGQRNYRHKQAHRKVGKRHKMKVKYEKLTEPVEQQEIPPKSKITKILDGVAQFIGIKKKPVQLPKEWPSLVQTLQNITKNKSDMKVNLDLTVSHMSSLSSWGEVKQYVKLSIQSYIKVVNERITPFEEKIQNNKTGSLSKKGYKYFEKYVNVMDMLDRMHEKLSGNSEGNREDKDPISKQDIKHIKNLQKKTLAIVSKLTGTSKKATKKRMCYHAAKMLNEADWSKIQTNIQIDNKTYTSIQTPASKMQSNIQDHTQPLFEGYGQGGVSSMDTKNSEHATNLWSSELKSDSGKTLFEGIRSGSLSPYGIKNKQDRQKGADIKAKETVIAGLAKKGLLEQAIDAANGSSKPPELNMLSISLLTTGLGSNSEREMQKTQTEAFKKLAEQNPIELTIPGPNKQSVKIKFVLKANLTNLPVNVGGVGFASILTSGKHAQLRQNKPVMEYLFGPKKLQKDPPQHIPGGLAGERLKELAKEIDEKEKELHTGNESEPGVKVSEKPDKKESLEKYHKIEQLKKKMKLINQLATQCGDIFYSGTHYQNKDVYKLTSRLALLAHALGMMPMYNCKSGKDRTGMQDAEIKFLAVYFDKYGKLPKPGEELEGEAKALYIKTLLSTGNLEVQKANVGVSGYKTEHVSGIDRRINDPVAREIVRGASPLTK